MLTQYTLDEIRTREGTYYHVVANSEPKNDHWYHITSDGNGNLWFDQHGNARQKLIEEHWKSCLFVDADQGDE